MKLFYTLIAFLLALMSAPVFAAGNISLPGGMLVTVPSEFKAAGDPLSFSVESKNVYMNIITEDLSEEMDLSSDEAKKAIVDIIVAGIKEEIPAYELSSYTDFSAGGYSGILLKGKALLGDVKAEIMFEQYIFIIAGKLYNINCVCPADIYGIYADVFNGVAKSLRKK